MSGRSVLLLAEFFVSNEAGQNGVSGKAVNSHENGTNTISSDENKQGGEERRVDVFTVFVPFSDDEESTQGGDGTDKDFTEGDKDSTDTGNDTESDGVSVDQEEGVLGRDTEVFTGEGNLDVGVLVQESDESFEAGNVALETGKSVLDDLSFFALELLGLVLSVGQHDSDQLDDGDDQRTKGNGTNVISDKSIDTLSDGARSALAGSLGEVPEADRTGDDELGGGEDEGVEPEETEQVVDQQSLQLGVVLEGDDVGAVGIDGSNLITRTDQVQRGNGPVNVEGNEDEAGEGREEENRHGFSDVIRSGLHDGDGQSDSAEQAEDDDEGQGRDGPQEIGKSLQRGDGVVVGVVGSGRGVVDFFLVLCSVVESPSENGVTNDEAEDSSPGQNSRAVSHQNHVDETDHESDSEGTSDDGPGGLDITEPLLQSVDITSGIGGIRGNVGDRAGETVSSDESKGRVNKDIIGIGVDGKVNDILGFQAIIVFTVGLTFN